MTADIVVIGGGIVGITIASALSKAFTDARITLLEKEPKLGAHASARNSGVLHAGFYYSDDSLKARFTKDGNRRLTEYCLERGVRINRCGKLVVAKTEEELGQLAELERRARANAVEVHYVTAEEIRELEPRARSVERALFSPTTSSVHPREVIDALAHDARAAGVTIRPGTAFLGHSGAKLRTSAGLINAGYVVNAAGLYADSVAHQYGFGSRYRILPFKGLYLTGDERELLRTHIYPVPNLQNPFTGVHLTVTVEGRVKIGPTATPAFWREQYGWLNKFRWSEFIEIVSREASLLIRNDFGFRDLAVQEIGKYRRDHLVALAAPLVDRLDARRYRNWGTPGIRAQLIDVEARRLVMDFLTEGNDQSFHVLNAVSPAFTCALPFADYVAEQIVTLIR